MHKKVKIKIILITSLLVSAFFLGLFYSSLHFRKCKNNLVFVNPYFACKDEVVNKKEYIDFKIELLSFIENQKRDNKISSIAVYFRDLKSGPTFGINDREDFIPASLLKLPVALTIFDLSEEKFPDLLSQKLEYTNKVFLDNNKEFPPEEFIKENTPYTINELTERMIKYSDNLALELVNEHLLSLGNGKDLVAETYRDLGILSATDLDSSTLNAKGYSSIFRMLYNASFLSKDNSEKLLSYLSESTFNEGLRMGVPKEIKIAHKFGERELDDIPIGENQLHDCGIIYYPDNPYILCIMTRGKEIKDLENTIAEISKKVYKEFSSRRLLN